MVKYISDCIDLSNVSKKKFNIIASGTGTGKTYFISNKLTEMMSDVKPNEILYVTSRAMIRDQQSNEKGIERYHKNKTDIIDFWNGKVETEINSNIQIMTYDALIDILDNKNNIGYETLSNIKVVVFDECHALFSDTFIKDLSAIKIWTRDTLYRGSKIFIGLTATPGILKYYQNEWGVTVNRINKDILINHKVKKLHCTDFKTIPYIVTTQLEGKTMIMCFSYSQCKKLQTEIPNSFVLISKSNKKYFTGEMDRVRGFIIKNETLPDTFIDENGEERVLNVLITTSTLREGVNLRENSGVKNVICCFSDELHITQFVGRCRYSVDNLIVADTYVNVSNFRKNKDYLTQCRSLFQKFIYNAENTSWFDTIKHLISHDDYEVKRFVLNPDEQKFIEYINVKWLVPSGTSDKDLNKYKIYKQEDKDEIINMVYKCKLLKLYMSQISFNKCIDLMKNTLGYVVEDKRGIIQNKRHSYKLVVDFNENDINEYDWDYVLNQ